MKKILLIFAMLFAPFAHAAEMVNVEYVHSAIAQKWAVNIPYNTALENPKVAANMEYLLATVDSLNEILNGEPITHYGTGEYATHAAADTIATNRAITDLVHIRPRFWLTTTADTDTFTFSISARGAFLVDWGDDSAPEIIVKSDVTTKRISHEYAAPGAHTISIGGRATRYNNGGAVAAISFRNNQNVAEIRGSLGAIFGTIGNPNVHWTSYQPRFIYTFSGCKNLAGEIPPELFQGVRGIPVSNMFYELFYSCGKLSGPIPAGLFSGLRGAPANSMFNYTFTGCSGLTGEIPAGQFASISGKPAAYMFKQTFSGCKGLQGEIPRDLFGDISGPAQEDMFKGTFSSCTGLHGASAQINGKYLYEIWPDATTDHVGGCYSSDVNLTDYDDMPYAWKHWANQNSNEVAEY